MEMGSDYRQPCFSYPFRQFCSPSFHVAAQKGLRIVLRQRFQNILSAVQLANKPTCQFNTLKISLGISFQ